MTGQILCLKTRQGFRARLPMAGLAALAAIAVAGMAGCGGGGESGMTLADYMSQAQQIECQKAIECCTTYEIGEKYPNGTLADVQRCADVPQDMSALIDILFKHSIDSGYVVFDANRAANCLDSLEALTCAQYSVLVDLIAGSCNSPLVPQQDTGEPCRSDLDCLSGYCEGASLTTDGVCGAAAPGNGEQCDLTCAEGYFCEFHTCAPILADGETCGTSDECQSMACFTPEGETDAVCGVWCDGQ
jgi:hypothetical protein